MNLSHKTKTTLRTMIQVILGLAVIAPLLVNQVGGGDATGWLAGVVAVSGGVARFMASDAGQKLTGFLNTQDKTNS